MATPPVPAPRAPSLYATLHRELAFPPSRERVEQWIDLRGAEAIQYASAETDRAAWEALSAPLRSATLVTVTAGTYAAALAVIARHHARLHPAALPHNRGPWARVYLDGREGGEWSLEAGFVAFCVRQAGTLLNSAPPLRWAGTLRDLGNAAQSSGRFNPGPTPERPVRAGDVYLRRAADGGWESAGIVVLAPAGGHGYFAGVGAEEGRILARTLPFAGMDFVTA